MTDPSLASIECPRCGETIEFKKWFLDDQDAVAFCKNVDCFYVFYPSTGDELRRDDYLVHQRPYKGDRTLGIRPDRHGHFHHDNEPKNIKVPCPQCGRIFHQTKRMNQGSIKFKCPRCKHPFEMDPRFCITVPGQPWRFNRASKGIRPDKIFPEPHKPKITYASAPCPDCDTKVEFVTEILKYKNHVVICKDCGACFDPVTRKVVLRRPPDPKKPHMKQDEVKELLKKE